MLIVSYSVVFTHKKKLFILYTVFSPYLDEVLFFVRSFVRFVRSIVSRLFKLHTVLRQEHIRCDATHSNNIDHAVDVVTAAELFA